MNRITTRSRLLIIGGLCLLILALVLEHARYSSLQYVTFVGGLALFSMILGFLQPRATYSDRVALFNAWCFLSGIALLTIALAFNDQLYRIDFDSEEMLPPHVAALLLRAQLILPPLLIVPTAVTVVGLARNSHMRKTPMQRIYILGGLLMTLSLLGKVWYNLFGSLYLAGSSGVGTVAAGLFSYPTFLLLAVGAIVLGSMPGHTHLGGLPGTLVSLGYLLGAISFSVGVHLAVSSGSDVSPILGTVGLFLLLPALLVPLCRIWLVKPLV